MENSLHTPTTLQEAIVSFSNPDTAFRYMTAIRWPQGAICPHCTAPNPYVLAKRCMWKCRTCTKQFSIKRGSVMEDSPLGLDKWLLAMWLIANAKSGISSYEIHRALGITQKSAWFLLHRIRLAMHTGTFEKLSGTVEADETYVGGKARNMHASKKKEKIKGRGGVGKAVVIGLLERGGRVRTKVVTSASQSTLHEHIKEHVEPGSELFTDQHSGYQGISPDYIHEAVNHAVGEYVRGHVWTNGMENYWSLLKRTIKGTYVSCEPFHLFRYLDEQSFRYDHRKDSDGGRFVKVASSVAGKRLTYKKLIGD